MITVVATGCLETKVTPVDEAISAKVALKNFRMILEDARSQGEVMQLRCLEDLYAYDQSGDGNFSREGSSWHFVIRESGKKIDYIVHQNESNRVSNMKAILIATPCSVRIREGVFKRIVLTHDLEIRELTESEFRETVWKQYGSSLF